MNREYDSWQEVLPAYLIPQEASHTHQTAMTTQTVQTKEHDGKQGDIGDKRANGTKSDAIHVDYTVARLPVPGGAEL